MFNVFDKVVHPGFGKGIIIAIKTNSGRNGLFYLVEFDISSGGLHDGDGIGALRRCWYCTEDDLVIAPKPKMVFDLTKYLTCGGYISPLLLGQALNGAADDHWTFEAQGFAQGESVFALPESALVPEEEYKCLTKKEYTFAIILHYAKEGK